MPQPNWDDPDFFWRDGGFSRPGGRAGPGASGAAPFDVATLQRELAQLQRARWGGTSTVTYAGNGVTRTVTFKSDREMAAAITDLQNKIADALGQSPPRSFTVHSSKGW